MLIGIFFLVAAGCFRSIMRATVRVEASLMISETSAQPRAVEYQFSPFRIEDMENLFLVGAGIGRTSCQLFSRSDGSGINIR